MNTCECEDAATTLGIVTEFGIAQFTCLLDFFQAQEVRQYLTEPKVDPESLFDDIADLMESLGVPTVDAEVPGFREKLGW